MEQQATPWPLVWLVDGYNVVCSGLLGGRDRAAWWSEANRQELLALLERFDPADAELWVVFDGELDVGVAPEAGLRVRPVFAQSADAWVLEELRRRGAAAEVAVVTADRGLAGRARRRGARVVSPRELLGRCTGSPLPAG